MSTLFFGQFLLANGALSPADLEAAVACQRARNLRLGDLAVARGWLTAAQADEINALQRRLDQRFGSLATEMGLLSDEQVDELMGYQHSMHLHLGEALVEKGLIGAEAMARWLAEFERQRRQFAQDLECFLTGVPHAELVVPAIDLATKLFGRIGQLPALIQACSIGGVRWPPHPVTVRQHFHGERTGWLALSVTEPLLLHLGAVLSGAPRAEVTPMALRAAGDFLDMLTENLSARLRGTGWRFDAEPPQRVSLPLADRAVCASFATPTGEACLYVQVDG